MYVVIGLFLCGYTVNALNFDVDRVIEITPNAEDVVERSYFGYSLVLQAGQNPKVIVGAPKLSSVSGGAVFSCNINNVSENLCSKYKIQLDNRGSFNGNFLGAVIDGGQQVGDPLLICAPRFVTRTNGSDHIMLFWSRGVCFYQESSANDKIYKRFDVPLGNTGTSNNTSYYNFGYAQAGFDAFYKNDSETVYVGAVGVKNWQGTFLRQSIRNNLRLEYGGLPLTGNEYDYLGYKINYGTFDKKMYIIAGAPRGDDLLGKVILFNNRRAEKSLHGEELGSYFGSGILAVDVNNDGSDDLFVGAPTSAGKTFDEGCVYYYKSVSVPSPVKLVGGKKKGARFGTSITFLGDIDMDSYNDIAISAPFEDDGMGAVYIYVGGKDGINPTCSQRLSPSDFPSAPKNIRGFGVGLSNGADVVQNGVNDLAIGAYLSNRVFIVPTKTVIDFQATLESNVTTLVTEGVLIKYCLNFKYRTPMVNSNGEYFQLVLRLDYRVMGSEIYMENTTSIPNNKICRNVDVAVQYSTFDFLPFKFSLTTKILSNVFGHGPNVIEKSIPFAHGCGDDNICQTQILINVLTNTYTIVVGRKLEIKANVTAENVGETGYQCKLLIGGPNVQQIRLHKDCSFENSTYYCFFANKLDAIPKEEVLSFDITSADITLKSITIEFELKCAGENLNTAKEILNFDVVTQNSPYIGGRSIPESLEIFDVDNNDNTSIHIKHVVTVGNFGPSPANSDIYFLIPIFKIGKQDVFEFFQAENMNGNPVDCHLSNITGEYHPKLNITSAIKAPLNTTTTFDCFKKRICIEMHCKGDILYKSSETTKYVLIFQTTSVLLAKFFHSQPEYKNILAFVTTALVSNGTLIDTHITTLVLSSHVKEVPLWIIILAVVVGTLLLCLLLLLLFKCNFFKRQYRDKMNSEILLDDDNNGPPSPSPLEKLNEEDQSEEPSKFKLEFS